MPLQSAEQPVGTQCGKPGKQAAHANIPAWLEAGDGTAHQAKGCGHALVGPRAGRPHALRRFRIQTTPLRLGRPFRASLGGRPACRARPDDTPATQRLAQGRFIHVC